MFKTQCVLGLIALIVEFAHPWDFVVSRGDLLEFYTNRTKIDTILFPSHNLTALTFDEIHNTILYVDKQNNNDSICAHDISAIENKCLIERKGRNIHGLAFDPATEMLFFSDTNERSINWISLNSNKNENIFIKLDAGIPTDLAVDSCRGYVYWINTNLITPTIERARFDGSDREVIVNLESFSINKTYQLEPHSLIIDQQTRKMYWIEPKNGFNYDFYYTDLNGKNKTRINYVNFDYSIKISNPSSNTLAASNTLIYWADWCTGCNRDIWKFGKLEWKGQNNFELATARVTAGIAANYKIKEQIQEIHDCQALETVERRSPDGPFCVHGVKVVGKSQCKCAPGYIGERCDVSICENYCLHGSCTLNNEGLPNCSCEAQYSGDKCEVDMCLGYCMNNGECSLNEEDEPTCACGGSYDGPRCEAVPITLTLPSNAFSSQPNSNLAGLLASWRRPQMILIRDQSDP